MTNLEWMTSDTKVLIDCLMTDKFLEKYVDPWWCRDACPLRIDGECTAGDDCFKTYSDEEVVKKYLAAEHKD